MTRQADRDVVVSPEEGRLYTLFKWVVLGVLAVLLTMLLARGRQYAALLAPTLDGPAQTVAAGPLLLSGRADPQVERVAVMLNGSEVGTAVVASDGRWQLETVAPAAGRYEAVAVAIDPDGQQRAASQPVAFEVGGAVTDAETAPTLVIADVDDPATVALQGTGTPGTTVRVLRDGAIVGTATVDANGNWQLTDAVTRYATSYEAVGLAADDREIGRAPAVMVIVPELAQPLTAGGAPQFSGGVAAEDGLTRGTLRWQGTGEPRTGVVLVAGARDLGRTTVDADGNWTFEAEVTLAPGEYTLMAQMVAGANNLLAEASGALSVPDAQVAAEPVAPTIDAPEGVVTPGRLTLTGSGTPNATLTLTNNGQSAGMTTVNPDGRWQMTVDVEQYRNRFAAVTTLANGTRLAGDGETLVLVALAARPLETDAAPALTDLASAPGELDQTAATLNWSGRGEPGATVEIVDDAGSVLATAVVADDGSWQIAAPLTLAPGDYALAARQVGEDDNVLAVGEPVAVSVPSLRVPSVDAVTIGGLADDPVTLRGTAPPNAQIEVLLDDAVAGVVTADTGGNWRYATALVAEEVVVQARSLDDPTAISEPKALAPGEAGRVVTLDGIDLLDTAGRYAAGGAAAPRSEVELLIDGVVADSALADGDGRWAVFGDLPPGSYRIAAREVGVANRLAQITLPRTLHVPAAEGESGAETDALSIDLTTVEAAGEPGALRLAGVATPGADVEVIISDGINPARLAAQGVAGADGIWQTEVALEAGSYTASVRELDAVGIAVLASNARPFVVTDSATGNRVAGTQGGLLRLLFTLPEEGDPAAQNVCGCTVTPDEPAVTEAAEPLPIELPAIALIVDASWSMTLDLSGNRRLASNDPDSRIVQAKAALRAMLATIPAGAEVALRAFGNLEGNLSCRTDLMLPLTPFEPGIVAGVVDGIVPQNRANTAIAAALDAVAEDLADAGAAPRVVVLLTDGEETCGGDPLASARRLVEAGIDVQINIVGFALADEALKAQFAEVATLTGGRYFDAADGASLTEGLAQAVGVPYRVLDGDGGEVAVGVVGGPALLLPPGDYTAVITLDGATVEQPVRVRAGRLTLAVPRP